MTNGAQTEPPFGNDSVNSILRELRCPVCLVYMIPPIYQCFTGHSICKNCSPRLNQCPTCRKDLLPVRNIALENLAAGVKYPCFYRLTGCNKAFPMHLIEGHERECQFGSQQCPFAVLSNEVCTWLGPFSGIKKHIQKDHNKNGNCVEIERRFHGLLINLSEKSHFKQVVFALGETFYMLFKRTGNIFFVVGYYIGPMSESSKYKYRFSLTRKGIGAVSYCLFTRGLFENVNEVFDTGNCVNIHYGCVQKFTENDCLAYEIEFLQHDNCDDSDDSDDTEGENEEN